VKFVMFLYVVLPLILGIFHFILFRLTLCPNISEGPFLLYSDVVLSVKPMFYINSYGFECGSLLLRYPYNHLFYFCIIFNKSYCRPPGGHMLGPNKIWLENEMKIVSISANGL
jgi:hypothetical protein